MKIRQVGSRSPLATLWVNDLRRGRIPSGPPAPAAFQSRVPVVAPGTEILGYEARAGWQVLVLRRPGEFVVVSAPEGVGLQELITMGVRSGDRAGAAFLALTALYFLNGTVEATFGSRAATVQAWLHATPPELGGILAAFTVGLIGGGFAATALGHRAGTRPAALIAAVLFWAPLVLIGMVLMQVAEPGWPLAALIGALWGTAGLGNGLIDPWLGRQAARLQAGGGPPETQATAPLLGPAMLLGLAALAAAAVAPVGAALGWANAAFPALGGGAQAAFLLGGFAANLAAFVASRRMRPGALALAAALSAGAGAVLLVGGVSAPAGGTPAILLGLILLGTGLAPVPGMAIVAAASVQAPLDQARRVGLVVVAGYVGGAVAQPAVGLLTQALGGLDARYALTIVIVGSVLGVATGHGLLRHAQQGAAGQVSQIFQAGQSCGALMGSLLGAVAIAVAGRAPAPANVPVQFVAVGAVTLAIALVAVAVLPPLPPS
ncbi:MAG TPA: hypothetical protein VKV27_07845 [Solirubrobacteraceae bacterium]|nr:hypothetical protein [Solirubrobacteraceae bacterium]